MNPVLAEITTALGWTLIHFLWQGTAIALTFWLISSVALKTSSAGRYAAASAAVIAMLITAGATFMLVYETPSRANLAWTLHDPGPTEQQATAPARPPATFELHSDSKAGTQGASANAGVDPVDLESQIWQPIVVILWALGVCLLLVRFSLNWGGVLRLRRDALPLTNHALTERLGSLWLA